MPDTITTMNKILSIILLLTGVLTLTACHDKSEDEHLPLARRTVIVYMMAENSLSNPYCQNDINEMIAAQADIPLDCNFVVYCDNTQKPYIFTIDRQRGRTLVQTLEEHNSTDSATFVANMRSIMHQYPAHHYGLVMWSHGSGWIPQHKAPAKTIGIDNMQNSSYSNRGSEMNITTMRNCLENIGAHFDYILFDACFMQCVEVDYELHNVADFVIASPAEIPANGAPYNLIMPALMSDTLAAHRIADIYYEHCTSGSKPSERTGLIISVADCAKMPALLDVTRRLLPDFYTTDIQTTALQSYAPWSHITGWMPEFYDMGSTMNQILPMSDYTTWAEAMDEAYPVRHCSKTWVSDYSSVFLPVISDSVHFAGASIFIPQMRYNAQDYNSAIRQTLWYKDYTRR